MTRLRNNKTIFLMLLLVSLSLLAQQAWAISPAEPQSGGRFFALKNTREGQEPVDYNQSDYISNGLSRTETGAFEREYYAKGLKLGPVHVMPSIGYTGEYDSNIFLTERNEKGDYISRLLGGLTATMPLQGGKYLVMAGVQSKSEWFAKNSNANHTDWTYQLGTGLNFNAFNVAVNEEFRDTTGRTDSELTNRIQRYENRLTGLLTVPFGKFFSENEVNDFFVNFRNNNSFEQFNRHELSFYPRFGLDIGQKTQALVEYGFTNISYEKNEGRDGTAHQGQLGVRGYLGNGNLIAYQLWGGWQFRQYDSNNFQGFSGIVAHGEIAYQPTELTKIILQGVRKPEESTSFGQSFFTRNEASLKLQRQIARSWFAHVQGGVGFSHYANDRLDFSWEPSVGLEYLLPGKRFALFTEYKFSARQSDAANNDYDRHIANFGIKAQA